jgi:hypothetical protein
MKHKYSAGDRHLAHVLHLRHDTRFGARSQSVDLALQIHDKFPEADCGQKVQNVREEFYEQGKCS